MWARQTGTPAAGSDSFMVNHVLLCRGGKDRQLTSHHPFAQKSYSDGPTWDITLLKQSHGTNFCEPFTLKHAAIHSLVPSHSCFICSSELKSLTCCVHMYSVSSQIASSSEWIWFMSCESLNSAMCIQFRLELNTAIKYHPVYVHL